MAAVIVEAGENFKNALPGEIGKIFPISTGEKLYIVASEDLLLIRKIPKNPPEALDKLMGEVVFDKKAKRRAEKWLLSQAKKRR